MHLYIITKYQLDDAELLWMKYFVFTFSVEQLFEEFVKVRNQAMEPLTVSSLGTISLMEQYTLDPKAIYSLFYIQRQVILLSL